MLGGGLACIVAAVGLGFRELLFVGVVLVVLVVGMAVLLTLRRPALAVHRTFEPGIVSIGEISQVTVDVANTSAAAGVRLRATDRVRIRVADARRGGERPQAAAGRFVVPALAPLRRAGSRIRRSYDIDAVERGVHRVGPLRVERTDPFGVITRRDAVGVAQAFVVTPRVHPLDDDVLDSRASGGSSAVARPSVGSGADDVIPREYRAGDAMRRVHWRATARTGALKVRQDEESSDPHGHVVLDTRADRFSVVPTVVAPGGATDARAEWPSHERFEWAVSMAASVVTHLLETGVEPHLSETVAHDRSGSPGDEIEAAHDLLVRLAEVQPVAPAVSKRSAAGDPTVDTEWAADLVADIRDQGGTRPVIAVLGALAESDLDALESLAAVARPAIAFLVGADEQTAEAVERAGWYAVALDRPLDQSAAWATALAMRRLV